MNKKNKSLKSKIRTAGFISINLAVLTGCSEPEKPPKIKLQDLFKYDASAHDSSGSSDAWKKYLNASALYNAWAPHLTSPWRAYYKSTLIAAVQIVESAAKPLYNNSQANVETEAKAFLEIANLNKSCVFVDLEGEKSVTWAAIIAEIKKGQPIATFNNWPHQNGLVLLHRTLGALLYYASKVEKNLNQPIPSSAPVFMLDRNRLTKKGAELKPEEFDNRYYHVSNDFPSEATFKQFGINKIYYVTNNTLEEDDLNAYFTGLAAMGIQFYLVNPNLKNENMVRVYIPVRRLNMFDDHPSTSNKSGSPGRHHFWHYSRPSFGGGSGSGFFGG